MIVFPGFDVASTVLRETLQSMAAIAWVLIPIAGIIWLLVAGLSEEKTRRHRQELLHQERMMALEKGMTEALEHTIATDREYRDRHYDSHGRHPHGLLVGGIITMGVGVGMTLFFRIVTDGDDAKHAMAIGLIPLFVGLSLLVAWFVTRRLGETESADRPRGRS
jgi:hypothetical protein